MTTRSQQTTTTTSTAAKLRRRIWAWHFYAGLITLPVMIVASLTGAALVFAEEFKEHFDRQVHFVPAATVSVSPEISTDALASTAIAALHSTLPIQAVYRFADPHRATVFVFEMNKGYARATRVGMNPHTGEVASIQRGATRTEAMLDWIEDLHRSLLSGYFGRVVVELTTAWGIVLLLTGIYLWWPKTMRLAGVWTLRLRGRPAYIQWRDIHTIPSIYLAVFTLLILLSGLFFSPLTGLSWMAATFATNGIPEPLHSPPTVKADPEAAPATFEALFASAKTAAPTSPIYDLAMPGFPGDTARITAGSVHTPRSTRVFFLNPQTASVISAFDGKDMPLRGLPLSYAYSFHVGSVGGMTTKVIACISCIALVAASVTGAVMWLIRRPAGKTGFPSTNSDFTAIPMWIRVFMIVLAVSMPPFGVSLLILWVGGWGWRRFGRSLGSRH